MICPKCHYSLSSQDEVCPVCREDINEYRLRFNQMVDDDPTLDKVEKAILIGDDECLQETLIEEEEDDGKDDS